MNIDLANSYSLTSKLFIFNISILSSSETFPEYFSSWSLISTGDGKCKPNVFSNKYRLSTWNQEKPMKANFIRFCFALLSTISLRKGSGISLSAPHPMSPRLASIHVCLFTAILYSQFINSCRLTPVQYLPL